jgi:succinoglycan biosynthesis transport protein ExoP
MELIEILKTLAARKWLLIIIPIITGSLTYFAVRSTPRTYKSRAQIATGITEAASLSLSSDKEFLQPFIIDNRFNNLTEIAKSKLVFDKVGAELLLHDLTDKKPYRTPKKEALDKVKYDRKAIINLLQTKLATAEPINGTPEQERSLQKVLEVYGYDIISLLNKMMIARIPDTDFIKFEIETENPALTAAVVNTSTIKLIDYSQYMKSRRSNNSVGYFEKLTISKKKDLDDKVAELKRFKQDNQVMNYDEETRTLIEQIKSLEERLQAEREKIPAMQAALNNIDNKFSPNERKYFEDQAGVFNRRLIASNARLTTLSQRYYTTGFDNERLRDSIFDLRKSLDYEVRRSADGFLLNPNATKQELVVRKMNTELDLQMAKSNVGSIQREVGRLKSLTGRYAPIEAALSSLERDISLAKDAYMMAMNKFSVAQSEQLNNISNLRVVEVGQTPEYPESQKLAILLALTIIVTLLVVVVIIFMLEYFDQRVKSASRFRRIAGLPVISSVNLLPNGNLDLRKAFNQTENPDDVTLYKAYLRHIRNIFVEDGSQAFLFTGFNGDEGKTTLITSLAVSLALLNKRVLVIDANFKNNGLTSAFFAKQVLVKDEPLTSESVSPTDLPQIDVVGTKIQAMSPAEILSTNGFEHFMAEAKKNYHYILIESASLERNFDAEELLPYADRVIAVFAASEPLREDDKARLRFFSELGHKFMGAILNQVKKEYLEDIVSQQSKKTFKWFGRSSNAQGAASIAL